MTKENSSNAWAVSAARNLVDLSSCLVDCTLSDDDVSWIAANVQHLFIDKAGFNEFVRMCTAIPGDMKLWIVVP